MANEAPGEAAPAATPSPSATPQPTPTLAPAATPNPTPAPAESPAPTPTPAPTNTPEFKIRDEYKDKPWANKIKSEEDLYKQVDNLNALVGKKTVVPDLTKATPKELSDYYAQVRPAEKSAYQFPEEIAPQLKDAYSEMFFENGIALPQAANLIKRVNELQSGAAAEALKTMPISEILTKPEFAVIFDKKGFHKELEDSFGTDFDKPAAAAAKELASNLNAKDQELLKTVPNQYLGLIYRLTNNLQKAYGASETGAPGEGGQGGGAPTDMTAVRKEIRAKITALSTRPHEASEKEKLVNELNDTYKTKR